MKKIAALFGLAALAFALSGPVYAREDENAQNPDQKEKLELNKEVVKLGDKLSDKLNLGGWKITETERSLVMKANGDFRISGAKVESADATAGTLTVSLYGVTRTVSLSGAKILGSGGKEIGISDFRPGDLVAGAGHYDETTHLVTVSQIKDLSSRATERNRIQTKIDELLKMIDELRKKL